MSERRRDEYLSALELALGRETVPVTDDAGQIVYVTFAELLAEMDGPRLYELQRAFREILAFFAWEARGLEIYAFRRFFSEPFIEVIGQLKQIVANRVVDIGQPGVNLFARQTADDLPDADIVILRRLLRQPDSKTRQDNHRAFRPARSLQHSFAPSWLVSLFSGRRP